MHVPCDTASDEGLERGAQALGIDSMPCLAKQVALISIYHVKFVN